MESYDIKWEIKRAIVQGGEAGVTYKELAVNLKKRVFLRKGISGISIKDLLQGIEQLFSENQIKLTVIDEEFRIKISKDAKLSTFIFRPLKKD